MAHPYELHVEVTVPCLCCRAPRVFTFASASDQVVCAWCASHLGDAKAPRRDSDHVTMWAALYGLARDGAAEERDAAATSAASAAATIAELAGKAAGLADIVANRFSGADAPGVRELLETDVVRRAERNTELADRRGDRLMAVLTAIDRLHHDDADRPGFCSCGAPVATCAESRALEPQRQALHAWEAKNAALLERGERHALDPAHPLVVAAASSRASDRRRQR